MSLPRIILAPLAFAMFGCATKPSDAPAAAPLTATLGSKEENHSSLPAVKSGPRSHEASAPVTLAAFEVKEAAFSDFGMSVKTNLEVQWGGAIEWMQVSAVATASSAAKAGLVAGDRILAIDGRTIGEMHRDGMLGALFGREKGEASRMLVLSRNEGLPRFIRLVANPSTRSSHG